MIKAIFGEEVTEARTLWPGNGAEELDAEAFEELLELNPEVCVEISGEGTFSREQVCVSALIC